MVFQLYIVFSNPNSSRLSIYTRYSSSESEDYIDQDDAVEERKLGVAVGVSTRE